MIHICFLVSIQFLRHKLSNSIQTIEITFVCNNFKIHSKTQNDFHAKRGGTTNDKLEVKVLIQ